MLKATFALLTLKPLPKVEPAPAELKPVEPAPAMLKPLPKDAPAADADAAAYAPAADAPAGTPTPDNMGVD